jgi:Protein of unknown function (DUF1566)
MNNTRSMKFYFGISVLALVLVAGGCTTTPKAERYAAAPPGSTITQAPELAYGQEVGRDGVYIAYANGIVRDTKTGLEWVVGPDMGMDRIDAKAWANSLNVGGVGWRLPTLAELKGLYQYSKGDYNMTPLLKTTGPWVWSSQDAGMQQLYFNFDNGRDGFFALANGIIFSPQSLRAFAVRSRSGA